MFHFKRTIPWVASSLIGTLLLLSISFSSWEIASQRLEPEVSRAIDIQRVITSQCVALLTNQNTPLERWFIEKLLPSPLVLPKTNAHSCVLRAHSVHVSRFALFSQWNLGIEIFSDSSVQPILSRSFSTSFPLPLSFLPLLIFMMMIPYGVSNFGCLALLLSYFLFLSGLNLIPLIKNLPKFAVNIITTDRLFPGLFLLSFWLAMRPLSERRKARSPLSVLENLVNSLLTHLVGIWNPIFYTLLGPLFSSSQDELKKLKPYLNVQLLILTLSLYVYGLELSNIYSVVHTFLTPRYLSFSIIFCFATYLVPQMPSSNPVIWKLPNFGKYMAVIGFLEFTGFLIPEIRSIPTLTRIGLAFLIVEFAQFRIEPLSKILTRWKAPLFALLISSLIATVTSELGAVDLIISICHPKKHPSAVLPFTLISGFLLGFISGGLSFPFFTLVSSMVQSFPSSLIRAALFDGVLAGLMLSPFSLFNLLPSFQNNISLPTILGQRFRQLLVPLIMGTVIYLVGTVTNLAILPPVCFVFGCLIIITARLKKSRWKISRFDVAAHSDQHSA